MLCQCYLYHGDGLVWLEITQRSLGPREPHIAETTSVEIATTASRIATAYFLWLFTCGISKDHTYLLYLHILAPVTYWDEGCS